MPLKFGASDNFRHLDFDPHRQGFAAAVKSLNSLSWAVGGDEALFAQTVQ
jgi:hypothetical protein